MTTKKPETEAEARAASLGVYTVDGDRLVAVFGDRRREMSLRMPMRRMIAFTQRAQGMSEAGTDVGAALATLAEFIPDALMDDDDLDFSEVLEMFTQWSQAVGDRLGKALT